jgi:3-isopropylmalate dehydrogenase
VADRGARIVLLPGDGIGPEVVACGRTVLEVVAERCRRSLALTEMPIGGGAIDALSSPLPEATLNACREADAVLLGAVGGPKWDDPSAAVRPEQGLLGLRQGLGLFANLRPVHAYPALATRTALKTERLTGVDLVIVRELTGGAYFGAKSLRQVDGEELASDAWEYRTHEIERIVRLAGSLARSRDGRITCVDKANVLETSRLWRRVAGRILAAEFPDLNVDYVLVDACAMLLIQDPRRFDVIVTENLFGDILSDEAAVLAGSIGLLPSASLRAELGDTRAFGLYEPIHGSAPDLVGSGLANPIGMILSVAMLLEHSLGLGDAAQSVRQAVASTIEAGMLTPDCGGHHQTMDVVGQVVERIGRGD